jgi:hypothetical protein
MESTGAERASIHALKSTLNGERASQLNQKLQVALNLLDEYDKTGNDVLLELALRKHQDVVDAIGKSSTRKH